MSVDWTKPIQTRDGRKARLLGIVKGAAWPVAVAVEKPDGSREEEFHYKEDGTFGPAAYRLDIFNIKEKIKLHIFANDDGIAIHSSVPISHTIPIFDESCEMAIKSGNGIDIEIDPDDLG